MLHAHRNTARNFKYFFVYNLSANTSVALPVAQYGGNNVRNFVWPYTIKLQRNTVCQQLLQAHDDNGKY